jgi:hypothetical protein
MCNESLSDNRNNNIWHMVAAHPDIQIAAKLLDWAIWLEEKENEHKRTE